MLATSAQDVSDSDRKEVFPWLNATALAELPQPLKRDVETRAVERLFIDWTMNPCNHGASPGHLYRLPWFYDEASETSILRLAVRTLAFAGIKNYQTETGSLHLKARQSYGDALSSLREIANDSARWTQDQTLASLILLDDFETMYLDRNDPLGPHSDAIRHILHARGDQQFTNRAKFGIWRVAHHRLLARQLLLGEEPSPTQFAWLDKLNIGRPDLHITSDSLKIAYLNSAVKKVTEGQTQIGQSQQERVNAARGLAQQIQECIDHAGHWPDTLSKLWRAKRLDPGEIRKPEDNEGPLDLAINPLGISEVLNFHDIWLAGYWNFHAAAQIIIREARISVIKYVADQQRRVLGPDDLECIATERIAVQNLSRNIICSVPPLLGYRSMDDTDSHAFSNGKMLGRFFSFFSLWTVQRSSFALSEHKELASGVTRWIRSQYSLS